MNNLTVLFMPIRCILKFCLRIPDKISDGIDCLCKLLEDINNNSGTGNSDRSIKLTAGQTIAKLCKQLLSDKAVDAKNLVRTLFIIF